jgi:hypothetical protein
MTDKGKTFDRYLAELGAPLDLLEFARDHADLPAAWAACQRGDWLLWLAARLARSPAEQRAVVQAAAACARSALDRLPQVDPRLRHAIDAAETWALGVLPAEDVRAAAQASGTAVAANVMNDIVWATGSAAWAVAWTAVWFARGDGLLAAATAARHAAEAAAAGVGDDPNAFLSRCAALVRERLAPPALPAG